MQCGLFREAIEKYLQAYQRFKKDQSSKKIKSNAGLIEISLKIGICQKSLLNLEFAEKILDNLYSKKLDVVKGDIKVYLNIIFQYAEILVLMQKMKFAHKIISNSIKSIEVK